MKSAFSAINSIRAAVVAAITFGAWGMSAGSAAAAQSGNLPSYATGEESIRGRIVAFDGKYNLQLRDDRGYVDNVSLHDGTVINPTGLRLAAGQSVTIMGHNSGKTFEANEIDTPYLSYGAAPYGTYPGYSYGYGPYQYYGYPYRGYPAFGLGFRTSGFGFRGWF
jgi:small nuclear ribonucleoprotein (snRNP)-like protein